MKLCSSLANTRLLFTTNALLQVVKTTLLTCLYNMALAAKDLQTNSEYAIKTPTMNIEDFKNTLTRPEPPSHLSDLQRGLWYAAKGDWDAAHNIAQEHEGTKDFDHLHAHLHRVEGDDWNAGYWYRRAGVAMPSESVAEELKDLIKRWI